MRWSDTPETETPPDWSKEIPSDDRLSPEAKRRIKEVLEKLAQTEQAEREEP